MSRWKKTGYTALGWATWKVGTRIVKRKVRGMSPRGQKMKLAIPLLAVAVTGAVIASRSAS